uniref:TAFA chemokine like family member 5, like n=1 Tax=Echeneis naucrates TaxID=173247 RepID=A0A665WZU5_ECHNA
TVSVSGCWSLSVSVCWLLTCPGCTGQLAVGTCEIVMLNRDSSVPRRTIARQTARCACRRGQIAGTTRARPACVDARIVRSRQWCEMVPCLEGEVCSLLFNRSGWTCTRGSGRIKTVTVLSNTCHMYLKALCTHFQHAWPLCHMKPRPREGTHTSKQQVGVQHSKSTSLSKREEQQCLFVHIFTSHCRTHCRIRKKKKSNEQTAGHHSESPSLLDVAHR